MIRDYIDLVGKCIMMEMLNSPSTPNSSLFMLLYLVSASLKLFEANAIGLSLVLNVKNLPSVSELASSSSSSILPCSNTAPRPCPDASTSIKTACLYHSMLVGFLGKLFL